MGVGLFGCRKRDEGATVADGLAADALIFVKMSERNVGRVGRKHIRRNGMLAADENAPFGAFRTRGRLRHGDVPSE